MGIFETYTSVRDKWPVKAVEAVLLLSTRPVWRPVIGTNLDETALRERQADMAVAKARLGAATIREGLERDEGLRQFGEAMIVAALTDAGGSNDLIAQQTVKDIAVSVVEPEGLPNNRYLAPEAVDRAALLLREGPTPPPTDAL